MVLYQLMEANVVEATPGSPATHRDPVNTNCPFLRQLGKSHPRENNLVTTRREARRGASWYLLWGKYLRLLMKTDLSSSLSRNQHVGERGFSAGYECFVWYTGILGMGLLRKDQNYPQDEAALKGSEISSGWGCPERLGGILWLGLP